MEVENVEVNNYGKENIEELVADRNINLLSKKKILQVMTPSADSKMMINKLQELSANKKLNFP